MKIFLIGYMGSGKSTLGKCLAKQKNISFIDLDSHIEEKEGQSIKNIFETKGEIYFRKKEIEYLNKLLIADTSYVLALGGGTPCFGDNMKNISQTSENVFYLKYQPETLTKRLLDEKNHRPLIAELNPDYLLDFIRKHLFDRNPFYMQAKHIITLDTKNIAESLSLIESKII